RTIDFLSRTNPLYSFTGKESGITHSDCKTSQRVYVACTHVHALIIISTVFASRYACEGSQVPFTQSGNKVSRILSCLTDNFPCLCGQSPSYVRWLTDWVSEALSR